jgi:hypothetical protein
MVGRDMTIQDMGWIKGKQEKMQIDSKKIVLTCGYSD